MSRDNINTTEETINDEVKRSGEATALIEILKLQIDAVKGVKDAKYILDLVPAFVDQTSYINSLDWNVTSVNSTDLKDIKIPAALGFLIAPAKLSITNGFASVDLIDRGEFEYASHLKLESQTFFNEFLTAFYSSMKMAPDSISVGKLRKKEAINTTVLNSYGVRFNEGVRAGFSDGCYPFALRVQEYNKGFYGYDISEKRLQLIENHFNGREFNVLKVSESGTEN